MAVVRKPKDDQNRALAVEFVRAALQGGSIKLAGTSAGASLDEAIEHARSDGAYVAQLMRTIRQRLDAHDAADMKATNVGN